jgi:hypothetical protein
VVYGLINQRIGDVLDEFTLADVADPSWAREQGEAIGLHLVDLGGEH